MPAQWDSSLVNRAEGIEVYSLYLFRGDAKANVNKGNSPALISTSSQTTSE
jgi:hypothetical protein